MDKVTDAIMLKDTATRGQVAMIYGIAGLFLGAFVLSKNS